LSLFRKPQAVTDGASSTSTIRIDLQASDLNDAIAYIKKQCNSIAKEVADGKAPPRKAPDDGVGGWLRPKEVGLFKDPEQEAEVFTCKFCNGKYTDARDSGGDGKKDLA
jgi:hypothetical protein